MDFLLSKPGDDEDKKKDALLQELKAVNDHLEKSGKPYFGGDDVCATDLSMAPKIKHVKIGADEIKVCSLSRRMNVHVLLQHAHVGTHMFCIPNPACLCRDVDATLEAYLWHLHAFLCLC